MLGAPRETRTTAMHAEPARRGRKDGTVTRPRRWNGSLRRASLRASGLDAFLTPLPDPPRPPPTWAYPAAGAGTGEALLISSTMAGAAPVASAPVPLGVVPVAVACAVVIYLLLRRARRSLRRGAQIRPMTEAAGELPEGLQEALKGAIASAEVKPGPPPGTTLTAPLPICLTCGGPLDVDSSCSNCQVRWEFPQKGSGSGTMGVPVPIAVVAPVLPSTGEPDRAASITDCPRCGEPLALGQFCPNCGVSWKSSTDASGVFRIPTPVAPARAGRGPRPSTPIAAPMTPLSPPLLPEALGPPSTPSPPPPPLPGTVPRAAPPSAPGAPAAVSPALPPEPDRGEGAGSRPLAPTVSLYDALVDLGRRGGSWLRPAAGSPPPSAALRRAASRRASGPSPGPGPSSSEGPRWILSELPVLAAHAANLPQSRGFAAAVPPGPPVAPPSAPRGQPRPTPAPSGFGWKIAIAYAAIAVPLLGFSPYFLAEVQHLFNGSPFPNPAPPATPYFFLVYDRLVEALGKLIFWPAPWPGPSHFLIPTPGKCYWHDHVHTCVRAATAIQHTAADFIFTMYVVLMVSFVFASAAHGEGRFTRSQRGKALGVIAGYVLVALFTEVFFYALRPDLFYSSFALVGRAFLGGLFFSFLLFALLVAPPAMVVRHRFARSWRPASAFFLTAGAALSLAFLLLFGVYTWLGVGNPHPPPIPFGLPDLGSSLGVGALPFGILLLLPLLSLLLWGLLGRLLYTHELRRRPVPPVEEFHPPVSILIPAYNEERTIGEAVAAADQAASLYPGLVEILVGNDGSTDGTSEAARAAMAELRHAHGRVIDLPHGGKSNALNGALKAATGEVLVRVDADTRMSPDYGFATMVPHFADPEVGGVQGLILPLQSEGWTRKLRMLELVWNHLFLRRAFYGTRCAQVVDGAFCAFRRADVLEAGGWVPWNGEDTEITLRLQRMGFRFRYETEAVSYEDVPENYRQLKKQRIRWTRGGYFAHHRHYGGLLSDAPEYGGLAILVWLAMFVRGGMRHLVYIYAALMTVLLGLETLYHVLIVVAFLLLARGLVMAYYLLRLRAYRFLPWILVWPVTSAVKQFINMEGFGTILPGAIPEFSE